MDVVVPPLEDRAEPLFELVDCRIPRRILFLL